MEDLRDKFALEAMKLFLADLLSRQAPPSAYDKLGYNSYAAAYNMLAARGNKDDGWIEWNGGECPVESGVMVDVILRNGGIYLNQQVWAEADDGNCGFEIDEYSRASYAFWRNDDIDGDIVKYRMS